MSSLQLVLNFEIHRQCGVDHSFDITCVMRPNVGIRSQFNF